MPTDDKHQTQWAAQFAVASELCKQGYKVAFTVGNHPNEDLMVMSPKGHRFGVDVKGQAGKNFWSIREKKAQDNLIYVLAFVPQNQLNQFFVMTQEEVERERKNYLKNARARNRKEGRTTEVGLWPGIPWQTAGQYLATESGHRWRALPE